MFGFVRPRDARVVDAILAGDPTCQRREEDEEAKEENEDRE
jgi:hypothetical protein